MNHLKFVLGLVCQLSLFHALADDLGQLPAHEKFIVGFEDVTIWTTRDKFANILSIEVDTIQVSPLKVDTLLKTSIQHAISHEFKIAEQGDESLRPVRILAMPGGDSNENQYARTIGDWKIEVPYAIYSLSYIEQEWMRPKGFKGIPIFVSYNDNSWGFLDIVRSTSHTSTEIKFYKFEHDVPQPQNPNAAKEFFNLILTQDLWQKATLAYTQKLEPTELKKFYIKNATNLSGTLDTHWHKELLEIPQYKKYIDLFANNQADRLELRDAFWELWNLSEEDANKNPRTGKYPNFEVSHWAIMAMLSEVSESNLSFLLNEFESEIRTTLKLAAHLIAPQFFWNLYRSSTPARPTRIFAFDTFINHQKLNSTNPEVRSVFEDLELLTIIQIQKNPESFFDELKNTSVSEVFELYLLNLIDKNLGIIGHLHPSGIEWLFKLVHEGKDPDILVKLMGDIRQRHPKTWFDVAGYMIEANPLKCLGVLKKLSAPN